MQPQLRISPIDRLANLVVIFSTSDWSVAEFLWDGEPALGIAWNGDLNSPADKGHPRSHGQGTWFILPGPVASLISFFLPMLRSMSK